MVLIKKNLDKINHKISYYQEAIKIVQDKNLV